VRSFLLVFSLSRLFLLSMFITFMYVLSEGANKNSNQKKKEEKKKKKQPK
jgi:Na+-transporting methylmalonyl-CoA/oxaloacetate decarboxylase gamma subunit